MKRIPRKLAARICWGLFAVEACAVLGAVLIPKGKVFFGFLCLAIALAMLVVLILTDLRCPGCGALVRPGENFCAWCGVKLEE